MTRQSQHQEGAAVRRDRRSITIGSMSLALLAACGPDAKGKFEEFIDESEPLLDMGPMKEDIPPMKEDIPTDPAIDLTGTALLAISTTIDPDHPLQFLSTVTQRVEGDRVFLDFELQALSLTMGMVTTPRMPVGDKLMYPDIEVVNGKYTIDAGLTKVVGMANPVTGSDIEATLVLEGTVVDADFVCGTVSGMLMKPLEYDLKGSTFAAVRLTDVNALPTDVTINCDRETRTDD